VHTSPKAHNGETRACHAHDLILVSEGVQCANCLALVHDRRSAEDRDAVVARPRRVRVQLNTGEVLEEVRDGTVFDVRTYYRYTLLATSPKDAPVYGVDIQFVE